MVNLNTINRITTTYNRVFNRRNNSLLNSVDLVKSNEGRHDKKDRRHLAQRRIKTISVLLERRKHSDRRQSRLNASSAEANHSIDTIV